VVLSDAEVWIRDVGEFHRWRMNNAAGKGKKTALAVRLVSVFQRRYSPSVRDQLPRQAVKNA
jgi:hypothetical protein